MSERLILFSEPTVSVLERLKTQVFPEFLKERIFAYMPSDGANKEANSKYTPAWRQFAETNGASFIEIDNSKRGEEVEVETQKLLSASILMITGGNTFKLLHNLRESGLDKVIREFWRKEGVVLVGFSAGAIVLTPSIETAKTGAGDANELGITDLAGLGIVDFEVWPHYKPEQDQEIAQFIVGRQRELKKIGNEEVLVIDK